MSLLRSAQRLNRARADVAGLGNKLSQEFCPRFEGGKKTGRGKEWFNNTCQMSASLQDVTQLSFLRSLGIRCTHIGSWRGPVRPPPLGPPMGGPARTPPPPGRGSPRPQKKLLRIISIQHSNFNSRSNFPAKKPGSCFQHLNTWKSYWHRSCEHLIEAALHFFWRTGE